MNHNKIAMVAIILGLIASTLSADCPLNRRKSGGTKLKITSTAFANNKLIPAKYTCDGDNVNPPLQIAGIPASAKSLALIVDDPDAPHKTFVHWVVWNIPPSTTSIDENSVPGEEGKNDFGKKGFGGACPPSGTHHYHFKVYALDMMLNLQDNATKADLEAAMKEHVLARAELVGLYKRNK